MAAIIHSSTINYSPILRPKEIRLVVLEKGSGPDPICCRLFHVAIGSHYYEALSYEWGSPFQEEPAENWFGDSPPQARLTSRSQLLPPPSHDDGDDAEISVNGEQVRVRSNLEHALWHIRYAQENRYLWIDALCIDQSNVLERNLQVQLMGKIYSKANHVIAWLGLSGNDSDLGMDMLVRLDVVCQEEGWERIYVQLEGRPVLRHIRHRCPVEFLLQKAEFEAISALTSRSYWHRAWITQEIQLARRITFQCGLKSYCVSTSSHDPDHRPYLMRLIALATYEYWEMFGKHRTSMNGLSLLSRKFLSSKGITLFDWIADDVRKDLTCSEPRDHIYAFLSIASDYQDLDIQPDYNKPLIAIFVDVLNLPIPGLYRNSRRLDRRILSGLAFKLGLIDHSMLVRNRYMRRPILPTMPTTCNGVVTGIGQVGLTQYLAGSSRLNVPWVIGVLPGLVYFMSVVDMLSS